MLVSHVVIDSIKERGYQSIDIENCRAEENYNKFNAELKDVLEKAIAKVKQSENEKNKSRNMENDINICLIPCGHTFCSKCIKKTDKCYICNSDIFMKQKIFI